MSRYSRILKVLFKSTEAQWDRDLFYNAVNDLDPDNKDSIDTFRQVVTVFCVECSHRRTFIPYSDQEVLAYKMNDKIRSTMSPEICDLYDSCVKFQGRELWRGDELYKAFAYDIIIPYTQMHIGKPTYVIECLKCAVALNSYLHKPVDSVEELKRIRNLLLGCSIDIYIEKNFCTIRVESEIIENRAATDRWMDMILARDYCSAYEIIKKRNDEHLQYAMSEGIKLYPGYFC